MKRFYLIVVLILNHNFSYAQNWLLIKDTIFPIVEIPSEFDSLYKQPLSNLGWEDGLHISNDGLNLYCTYVPIDFLSFVLNGSLPNNFSSQYIRSAPTFGMDLITNPIGATEWLHSDILYAHKNTITDTFNVWSLSAMARNFYSEGAPTPTFLNNSTTVEFMLFTSNNNPTNNTDIWIINNTSINPSGVGFPMPSPINTSNNEDNPQLVRLDNNNLILFFDSDNLPGGFGNIDIWLSESNDNGASWSTPSNVNSINTSNKEHQPFLHHDTARNKWHLYYSAIHTDGKLAIFRAEQTINNNWNSWGTPELVISAGNSGGIGEPTLTKSGDISFVVVYVDPDPNSIYNHFDSDPWFLRSKNTITSINSVKKTISSSIYPNPTDGKITINSLNLQTLNIYNVSGQLIFTKNPLHNLSNYSVNLKHLKSGLYFLETISNKTTSINKIIIR